MAKKAKLADAYVNITTRDGAFTKGLARNKGQTEGFVKNMEGKLGSISRKLSAMLIGKGIGLAMRTFEKLYGDAIKGVIEDNASVTRFMEATTVAVENVAKAVLDYLAPAIDFLSEKFEDFNGGAKLSEKSMKDLQKQAKLTKTDMEGVWLKAQEDLMKGKGGLVPAPEGGAGGSVVPNWMNDLAKQWSLAPQAGDLGAYGRWLMRGGGPERQVTPEQASREWMDAGNRREQLERNGVVDFNERARNQRMAEAAAGGTDEARALAERGLKGMEMLRADERRVKLEEEANKKRDEQAALLKQIRDRINGARFQ